MEIDKSQSYLQKCEEANILKFLHDIKLHNDREWFYDHKEEYDHVRASFEGIVERLIASIAVFDPVYAMVTVKSTLYRFNRDTRFSPDKSPYKRHFGSYINSKGKKSQHGGYYLHLEPGGCMIGGGAYCLEGPVLKAIRRSIVDNIDVYRSIVEAPEFKTLYPVIGLEHLKTLPVGFSKDFAYPHYLRPKNFAVFHQLPDEFFFQEDWMSEVTRCFKILKPFLDFVNNTIDDFTE